ncbi:hypothetical protein Csa_014345 [Cucumis sativus]|uniref:Uncharacterized protein n=1 Tax=Cucumis sativus TaxID=3659 RepID=A0A0A0LNU5_CUCSA|nr:hypothetical protein Csa_014345 [Cucumis sativus]
MNQKHSEPMPISASASASSFCGKPRPHSARQQIHGTFLVSTLVDVATMTRRKDFLYSGLILVIFTK